LKKVDGSKCRLQGRTSIDEKNRGEDGKKEIKSFKNIDKLFLKKKA
jgi:hypothetical protein